MEDLNHNGIPDSHEAKMAKADLYKLANYSMKLFKMIQEGQPMEGWVSAKITKAADYIASVYHFIEYEMKTTEYGDALENAEMYSESVRRAFEQKLTEAKQQKEKISKKAKEEEEVDESIEDRLAAAREKAAAKGKIKDKEETPKSNVRKVAGKSYGGSKQKDEKEVDEAANPKVAVKPRNFVAKNAMATTSGAGVHKDKKKAQKQGDVKHKGRQEESVDEGVEDRLAAAREKAAAKGKIKDKQEAPKSNVRKVAGKSYGGSKQKDDAEE